MSDLEIKPLPTKKTNVPLRALMKKKIIPMHPTLSLFIGRVRSGKSVLALNLIKRPEFYGPKNGAKTGYFNQIYVFSPTVYNDDLYGDMDIPDENKYDDPNAEDLQEILDRQKESIDARGIDKTERVLIIFDDCLTHAKFLRSKAFKQCIFAQRHYGISAYVMAQSLMSVPRPIRLQCRNLFFFQGSQSEVERISEEYSVCGLNKKKMYDIVDYATKEPYSFLYINMDAEHKHRFRKRFEEILEIEGQD